MLDINFVIVGNRTEIARSTVPGGGLGTDLRTGISGVFSWVFNFEDLYFLGTGHSCCIFWVVR